MATPDKPDTQGWSAQNHTATPIPSATATPVKSAVDESQHPTAGRGRNAQKQT